jgi:rhodanese-related sulfurtransferase
VIDDQPMSERPLSDLLAVAAGKIARLEPREAFEATRAGALIVDTRSSDARRRDGVIPGALHVPRTVFEWRLATDSEYRNEHVGGRERRLVVLCDHGYSSQLAAAVLADLGFAAPCDVIGGFVAWRDAGLPVRPAPPEPPGLPGSGPPDPE